jgi:cytochrome c553
MKKLIGLSVLLGSTLLAAGALYAAANDMPDWAYGIAPPGQQNPPAARDDGKTFSLPGSDQQFTLNKIRGRVDNDTPNRVSPGDWFPNDHPAMPNIVALGDQSRGIVACSLCHYPNGKGRSENASPAGLPKDYIIRQLHDMKDDMRVSGERRKQNTQQMVSFAKAMTDEEIVQAATYFSSMKWTPWVRVQETNTVPRTRSQGGMWIPLSGDQAGTEPIGQRIIEVPVDAMHTETLRDPHSGFIAYVPVGSVAKGKDLVTTGGNGKTIACATCHGDDLNGLGSVPGLSGRLASYNARQLYDFKVGARHGDMAELMHKVAAKLTNEDIIDITAYLASQPAPATVAYTRTAQQ